VKGRARRPPRRGYRRTRVRTETVQSLGAYARSVRARIEDEDRVIDPRRARTHVSEERRYAYGRCRCGAKHAPHLGPRPRRSFEERWDKQHEGEVKCIASMLFVLSFLERTGWRRHPAQSKLGCLDTPGGSSCSLVEAQYVIRTPRPGVPALKFVIVPPGLLISCGGFKAQGVSISFERPDRPSGPHVGTFQSRYCASPRA
jgi:hypothetical protein